MLILVVASVLFLVSLISFSVALNKHRLDGFHSVYEEPLEETEGEVVEPAAPAATSNVHAVPMPPPPPSKTDQAETRSVRSFNGLPTRKPVQGAMGEPKA